MLNSVMLIGNVGQDPEIRETSSGSVVNLSLATTEKWKSKDGTPQESTQWHRVTFFGKPAEIIHQYVHKGSKMYVSGSIEYREYEKDGEKKYATNIKGRDFKFLDSKSDGGSKPAPRSDQELNDDLPF